MMTSGDVCDLTSRWLSFVVYVLATTWRVSVMMMFRSRAARCAKRGAQDGNAGMCHNLERRLGMRRSSQRWSQWNAGWSTGCRACSPPFSICIEPSLRTLLRQEQASLRGLGVMTRRSINLAVDVGNLLQELCLCDCRDIRLSPAHVWRRPNAATVGRTQNAPASVFTL